MQILSKNLFNRIIYQNDCELLCNPHKKSQDQLIIQMLFATAFGILTGGVFLSGFAVYLGASDEITGYINLIPSITGIFIIFSGVVLERFTNRKRLVIVVTMTSRLLICSVVLVPLFVPKPYRVIVVLLMLVLANTLLAFASIAFNNWFISVVSNNIRGRFYALRQMLSLVLSLFLPLIAGRFMDGIGDKYIGFVVLYSLGALMILGETEAYMHIEEPPVDSIGKGNIRLTDIFSIPIKNREFLSYTILVGLINITLYISCSFTQVYMLKYLKLSYTFINSISILSAVLQIFFYRIWGRISDKYGHAFAMRTSMWFWVGELSLWAIMSRNSIYIMPIAFIFSAIANTGFNVGCFNTRYSLIPEKGRTLYDSFYMAVQGIMLLVSPMIGSIIKSCIAAVPFVQKNIQFGEFRLLYGISVLGIIALQVFNVFNKRHLKPASSILADDNNQHTESL